MIAYESFKLHIMDLMFNSGVSVIFGISLVISLAVITFFKFSFKYWEKRNVPLFAEPQIPFGSSPNPIFNKIHIADFVKTTYVTAKSRTLKHVGGFLFYIPKYLPVDPEYIKNVLQRDSNYFTERGFYYNERNDPLSANLFALGGEKWRILRTKLSPAFTSVKVKTIFEDILQCGYQMQDSITKLCANKETVKISDVSECFTIDVIGSCAFGLKCNSFNNPEAEFRKQGKKIFHFTFLRAIKTAFAFAFPKFSRWLGIRLFDKESTEIFINVVKETVEFRKTNNIIQKDFLQLLLQLGNDLNGDNTEKYENKAKFSIEELTAQVFIFFAAGFETSSLTLAYSLYELALNPDMQNRVREEINQVLIKHDGGITYDSVMEMKYMNQVVKETLRKYPPVPFITRTCVKDYQVPGTKSVIGKGIDAVISIWGLHHDPDYYPDPDKFDPERFSEENKRTRHPFTYIPFGEGPRICIGLRFGLMQTKVGLTMLLKHFKFSLNKITEVPLQMEPFSFALTPKKGIFLDTEIVE